MGRSHPERGLGAGLDDLEDCLGLGKVQATGKKGPEGKFPRTGQTRPLGQRFPQNGFENGIPGVAVDFHHVFPGIRLGGPHEGEKDFVKNTPLGVEHVPQVEAV
jgi:hypothetical protein